eukprot:CAMPEP_0197242224 /NCGR_PEP_ID=MMETSP1429-20130617/8040_1 /TAXON_ID=49237 /ORGANISM="Chaetoceros  sp., Strain UNC1202" /LENGTH=68 /DNA_ID=CAMNT_0042702209 /DNA_START=1 /DNA_END=207 /DNA_ORIENTATION=-
MNELVMDGFMHVYPRSIRTHLTIGIPVGIDGALDGTGDGGVLHDDEGGLASQFKCNFGKGAHVARTRR